MEMWEGKGPAFFEAMLRSEAIILRERADRLERLATHIGNLVK